MGWLQEHLDGFVKPYLGYIPEVKDSDEKFFTVEEMVLLKNIWRMAKREAKRLGLGILLTGRDTWAFHVLACRENYDHAYRPDICRQTKEHIKENYQNFFCLDTGFAGSIPQKLKCKAWALVNYTSAGAMDVYHGYYAKRPASPAQDPYGQWKELKPCLSDHLAHQAFPRSKGIRNIASRLEAMPKYWFGAKWVDPKSLGNLPPETLEQLRKENWNSRTGIAQAFVASKGGFAAAARVTIQVYKDKSPEFLPSLDKMRNGSKNPNWLGNDYIP